MNIVPHIPKTSRYVLGTRIENKFLDLLEISYTVYFSSKDKKLEKISESIFILDILKFLITLAWKAKCISHKQYEEIAIRLGEIGKMFGGWKRSLEIPQKKNPA
jgi:hypothetical protein